MSTTPLRIQLHRVRGWRKPPNTVCVGRPGKFGNPFDWQTFGNAGGVDLFQRWITDRLPLVERLNLGLDIDPQWEIRARSTILKMLPSLRGKNLACWCRLCEAHKDGKPLGVKCADCDPCHADVLLHMVNP